MNTSEILVNFITSVRSELSAVDLSLKGSKQNLIHDFFSCSKMDLNDQLLLLLNHEISDKTLLVIQDLLMKGADPNAIDSSGNAPIHLAIQKSPGNSTLVLELIQFGAHLNVVNKYGSTPLTFSLYKRSYKISEILIDRGIDINFQCRRGWTALMIASMLGDLRSVRMLLRYGAIVNKYDANKKTALMFACEGNYLNVIKELLNYGASPGMRDRDFKTVLDYYLLRPYPRLDVINELLLHCACFSNLANTPEESFLQIMNICLRGEPPYHACVRTIIKIQMLLTCDYSCITKFEDLYDFAVTCSSESRFMNRFKVNACSSLKDLLRKCLVGYMPEEKELEALLPPLANHYFPIYSDILRALLRKSFLREKFMKIRMHAKMEGQGFKISLPTVVHLQIFSYLSDDDVTNFVLASYVKFTR